MTESGMVDLSTVICVYGLTNCGAVLVHAIDYGEDRVLASLNGKSPEWCPLVEEYWECTGELETGFHLSSSLFVPLCEVMRFYGGRE